MRRIIVWGLVIGLVLLVSPVPSEAGGHVFFNFTIPLGVGPWWWGPAYPYYPYPYYAAPPVVVQQSPPVYQQQPAPQPSYWYYCPNPQGYYPYVRQCASAWMTVVPPSTAPSSGPTASPPPPR